MGLFWIGIGLLVIATVIIVLIYTETIIEDFVPLTVFLSIAGTVLFVSTLINSKELYQVENNFQEDYLTVQFKIEEYNKETNFRLLNELYEDCTEIDKTIERNKKLVDSKWRGKCYSRQIAATPHITPIFEEKFK